MRGRWPEWACGGRGGRAHSGPVRPICLSKTGPAVRYVPRGREPLMHTLSAAGSSSPRSRSRGSTGPTCTSRPSAGRRTHRATPPAIRRDAYPLLRSGLLPVGLDRERCGHARTAAACLRPPGPAVDRADPRLARTAISSTTSSSHTRTRSMSSIPATSTSLASTARRRSCWPGCPAGAREPVLQWRGDGWQHRPDA